MRCLRCGNTNHSRRVCGRCGSPLAQFSAEQAPVTRDLGYAAVDQHLRRSERTDLIAGLRTCQYRLGEGSLTHDDFAAYLDALAPALLEVAGGHLDGEERTMSDYLVALQGSLGRPLSGREEAAFTALCDQRLSLLETMYVRFEESLSTLYDYLETGDAATLQRGVYLADQAQEAYHGLPGAQAEFLTSLS